MLPPMGLLFGRWASLAAAVATSLMLIAAQERPFSGQFAVSPAVLIQVMPEP
jgi:hypothetical protein